MQLFQILGFTEKKGMLTPPNASQPDLREMLERAKVQLELTQYSLKVDFGKRIIIKCNKLNVFVGLLAKDPMFMEANPILLQLLSGGDCK
jgi:hypothetical protein